MFAAAALASVGALSVVTGAVTLPLHSLFLNRGRKRGDTTGPRSRFARPTEGGAHVRTLRTVVAPGVAAARLAQGLRADGHAPEPPPTSAWRTEQQSS